MLLKQLLKLNEMIMNRKRILFEEEDKGPEWVVVYHLGYYDFDDDLNNSDVEEIILNAPNFETAARYAQQYLRKMQMDEETADTWSEAEILSVELR